MRWYKNLYVGESLQGKELYYRYVIQWTKKVTGTWCLTPSANREDLIDICHSELLRVGKLYPKDQLVIGLAGSRREACELAGRIVLDVLNETGGTDVHGWFDE